MSQFSRYFKKLVKESGVNHTTLACVADVNRANLQNILSGSRKPSRKDIESVLPYLRASASQQDELLELLEGELFGPDVVERRACVRSMLEQFDQSFQAAPAPRQVWPSAPCTDKDSELISSEAAILNMLASLLSEGNRLGGRLVFFPWFSQALAATEPFHPLRAGRRETSNCPALQLVEFWKAPQAEMAAANLNALVSTPL